MSKSTRKRTIRAAGDIAYVPLTRGHEAIIDSADIHLVEGWNWHALIRKKTATIYAVRKEPRRNGRKRKAIYMHRIILICPSGEECDHRDGNGLNNRRGNLRSATHSENMRNSKRYKNNTSGLRGVSWSKEAKKWTAAIQIHGRTKRLGYFGSKKKARTAYIKASAVLHGEFRRA